jgi:hypothetical protein
MYLKSGILNFTNNIETWIRDLTKFKNSCYLNMVTYSSPKFDPPKDIKEAFGHDQVSDNIILVTLHGPRARSCFQLETALLCSSYLLLYN